ncbi:hypothetical protein OHA25_02325 [Nonomuraea sp. NBC_00507]|uniref:hypothetical protein n=1 Tax=Nonomuraea sp. NBC_00507 TaxID=2976002 RepID=UPI002E173AD2
MRFEEHLLMDLKAEIAARAERRRRIARRIYAGGAVAGLTAAAAIAVPLLTGTETPAYAVSKSADGTVRVEINEFRDADRLERDLKDAGVTADVTYLKAGTECDPDRGKRAGGQGRPGTEEFRKSPSANVARPRDRGLEIYPKYIGKDQTLLLEFAESDPSAGQEKKGVLWRLTTGLITGPVKPCVAVKDPTWHDVGGSEGQPPAGG